MYQVYKSGDLRGMKIAYGDGDGVVIWRPFGPDIEHSGPCFDLPVTDLESLLELGHILLEAPPDAFVDANADEDETDEDEQPQ